MGAIYFDNAATSWPKPPTVSAAMVDCVREVGGNPGRSGHRLSIAAARVVTSTREALAELFSADDPSRIVFAHNATHALNLALHGTLRPGHHVVTTGLEHNSVMRPLRHLETLGVEVTVVPCGPDGMLDMDSARRAFRSNTRLLVATHASNVAGSVLPVSALATIAHEHGALALVDAAQTAGAIPIDVGHAEVDLLAFTGHKSLLGPTGTGGLYVRNGVALTPLIRGGTGSASAHETQPDFLPDAHESGTLNVAGIAGLNAGVRFVRETGLGSIQAHEQALATRFCDGARQIEGVSLYGPSSAADRTGVVSFTIAGTTPSEVGLLLDDSFGIMARTGLHCSPSAHKSIGTFPDGTVRFSFGWFNTAEEIDASLVALREIATWAASNARGTSWTA
jgi:cysteine desulfurase family protein